MINLYWPVYKNLESALIELSDQIHFDDKQLSVYSVKISELLIRCAVEIESISKELYLNSGGETPTDKDLYFDTDCLGYLESIWLLSKKQIFISAPNFYFTREENITLTPLNKASIRGKCDWKKAYQAVKHNRTLNLTKGNLKNLIRALGALFLLNIYFKNESFNLKRDGTATKFDARLGSEIFSIKLHINYSVSIDRTYKKNVDFDECVYLTKATEETSEARVSAMIRMEEKSKELSNNHLLKTIQEELKKNKKLTPENFQKEITDILKAEQKKIGTKFLEQALRSEKQNLKDGKYEAIINKNQV